MILGQSAKTVFPSSSATGFLQLSGSAGDVIVVPVFIPAPGGPTLVASITDGAGFAWKRRKKLQWDDARFNALELWYAHATANFTKDLITINMTGASGGAAIGLVVSGVFNPDSPWDPHHALTSSLVQNGADVSLAMSTAEPDDMLLAFAASAQGAVISPAAGWTTIQNAQTVLLGAHTLLQAQYKLVSATQSGLAVGFANTSENVGMLADALTGDLVVVPRAAPRIVMNT